MPANRCGAHHPDQDGVTCRLKSNDHGDHISADGVIWENTEFLVSRPRIATVRDRKSAREFITTAARNTEVQRPVGMPTVEGLKTGAPTAAVVAWSKDEWQGYALKQLHEFLLSRRDPFTTPEHFWPLICAPQEKRALSVVVQKALRNNWMLESGATRLRDTYTSADGVEFVMNKLVPVYWSNIGPRINPV